MRALFAAAFVLAAATAAAQPVESLFIYGSSRASAVSAPNDPRGAILSRTRVGMRLDVLFDEQNGVARRIRLNAGSEMWTASFERLDGDAAGYRSWVGSIDGVPNSHVVFTERNGVVSGLINAVGITYQIRTESAGTYLIERVDLAALGAERDPPSGPVPAAHDAPRGIVSDASGVVDLLILYTPAARAKVGDTAQMKAIAAQVASDTNTAFARSQVRARVRLVGAVEIGFVEAAQMSSDLPALKFSTEARTLRDVSKADLVHLLVSSPDLASCGIGYLLSPETVDFDAYSIADVSCVPQYTPTHELAHNFGSHHAPEDGASGALFPYSYAYKDPVRGFRTIMAYPCLDATCPRILNFSNPAVDYDGAFTGTSYQDNARSINEAAAYVANFRTAGVSDGALPSAPTALRSDVNGNSVTVSWSPVPSVAPSAVATYVLQAGTTPGAANLFNASVGPATSMSGVLGAGSYYWRVVTVTSAGASAPSAEQQFVIGGCVSPSAPTDFRFSVSGRSVTLAWNAPLSGSPVNYLVEAGSQPTLANLLVAPVGAETTVGTSAPPGTYYVRIRAQNACGTSVPSNEQIILVP